MDPWVVSDVLRPNLEVTGFIDESVIHTVRVEKFFERAEQFVGMYIFFPFNFIIHRSTLHLLSATLTTGTKGLWLCNDLKLRLYQPKFKNIYGFRLVMSIVGSWKIVVCSNCGKIVVCSNCGMPVLYSASIATI